jgi:hypothetical protein
MTPAQKDDWIAELRTSLAYAQLKKTLRDEFAMAALTGLLANHKLAVKCLAEGGAESGWFEECAYEFADGMMKERHK